MKGKTIRLAVLLGAAAVLAVVLLVRHLGPSEDRMIRDVQSGDTQDRVRAIRDLADAGSPAAAETLARLAADPDTRVAVEAVSAVGRLRRKDLLPVMENASSDERPEVREATLVALGRMGDPKSAHLLLNRLEQDPSTDVQAAAADALGRVRSVASVETLLAQLDSPSERVRRSAAAAIVRIWQIDHGFVATDPPDKRRALIEGMRHHWEVYKQSDAYRYLKQKTEKGP